MSKVSGILLWLGLQKRYDRLYEQAVRDKERNPQKYMLSKQKKKEYELSQAANKRSKAEKEKAFYFKYADSLNWYMVPKKKYKYRRCERQMFLKECKYRNGKAELTDEQKKMLEYIDGFYDDYEERAEKLENETGEVLKDDGSWVCLPFYKYFPIAMSIEDYKNR